MDAAPASRRALCPRCDRPLPGCLCACVRPVDNRLPLLIIQDPREAHQAKGTARLLQLCLSRCERWLGDCPTPPAPGPWLLLYPGEAETVRTDTGALTPGTRLVLLDGTWRQSRGLLRRSPWLQGLPRLSLQNVPRSIYAIRCAQAVHQLSTLEAAALALQGLDPARAEHYTPLWDAMHDFVALQQRLLMQGKRLRGTKQAKQ